MQLARKFVTRMRISPTTAHDLVNFLAKLERFHKSTRKIFIFCVSSRTKRDNLSDIKALTGCEQQVIYADLAERMNIL